MEKRKYYRSPLWDDYIGMPSGENVDYPYIEFPKEADWRGYKLPLLKWGTDEARAVPRYAGDSDTLDPLNIRRGVDVKPPSSN